MNKHKPPIKKSLLLLLLLVLLSMAALWPRDHSQVQSFSFAENYTNASIELGNVQRDGIAFPFLFANAVKQPFSLKMRLGWGVHAGPRSLWMFAAQADNHGQVAVTYRGKQVGVVNNQLLQKTSAPVPALSYVGDVEIGHGRVSFGVTGSNPQLSSYYAELGLIVLAPRGMQRQQVLAALRDGTAVAAPDLGLLLLVLLVAFGVLFYASREGGGATLASLHRGSGGAGAGLTGRQRDGTAHGTTGAAGARHAGQTA